jgi:regulator of RNase E activity RraA
VKVQCRLQSNDRFSNEPVMRSLSKFPSSVLVDALGRERGLVPVGLHAIPSGFAETMVGNALTVSVSTGDNLMLQKAIDLAQPGDVIVCNCGNQTERAVAGELIFRYAASRDVRGLVIDGAVRDTDFLRTFEFPVYARNVSPLGPTKTGSGTIGMPITIGGAAIHSGDVIIGDADGLVVVPRGRIREALSNGEAVLRHENALVADIDAGTLSRQWIEDLVEVVDVEA